MIQPLLKIEGLKTYFPTIRGLVRAVDGVSLNIHKGEVVGVVGESGSGKSVTALSIMQLVPPPGKIVGGSIFFENENLLEKSESEMRRIRGGEIAMCFQDPLTYLNPVMRVGDQIAENILLHQLKFSEEGENEIQLSKTEAFERATEMIDLVGIPDPSKRVWDYPHQQSGGMRQRILLAMALSCNPKLLIADEPTTEVDVITQAQILKLMRELNERLKNSILFITHDMGIVAHLCDKIAVMYAGNIIEYADVQKIFTDALHPYTKALLNAIPKLGMKLNPIEGEVADTINPPKGCKFHPRCSYVKEMCMEMIPPIVEINESRFVMCHLYGDN